MNRFERFRQEQARQHDPVLLRGAVEFMPAHLNEAVTVPAKEGKKRKKRDKFHAGAAEVKKVAKATPAIFGADVLLSSGLLRRLLRAEPEKSEQGTVNTEAPTGEPRIEVEQQSITTTLSPFQAMTFQLDAPGAQQVEFIWLEEKRDVRPRPLTSNAPVDETRSALTSQNALQRVTMDYKQAGRFETQIGISDGRYLFAYEVDGYVRPEARFARRVRLNRQGLFSPRSLARYEHPVTLINRSKFTEHLLLEASVPWLLSDEARIEIPPNSSVETILRFHLPAMSSGLNEGRLQLSAERPEGASLMAGLIHVAAQVEVGGAVPQLYFTPLEFGEVRQGIDEPQLRVEISARGSGALTGMISLPHSGELADFRLTADYEGAARFAHTFHISSINLPQPQPHSNEAVLKVMLITDSFLANHRLRRAEIPYRLVHLKKSLPALSFGTVRAGSTKAMRLEVQRSDLKEIDLTAEVPSRVASYLEAYPARSNAYVFRLDANTLSPGTHIIETIDLIDNLSGLRDQIKLLATIEHGTG